MKLSTKQDFQALMHLFLDPLKPYYSAGGARLHLGETGVTYGQAAIELEAFSRPLWALVPYWAGGGSDPVFEDIYRRGLAAGADPENPEYWGACKDYDQCFVEVAAIACGLPTPPATLWGCRGVALGMVKSHLPRDRAAAGGGRAGCLAGARRYAGATGLFQQRREARKARTAGQGGGCGARAVRVHQRPAGAYLYGSRAGGHQPQG